MISAEAPLIFSKATEMFIQELTIKGIFNAEKSERKTLQRKDIAMAIAHTPTYDFLIDTLPREEFLTYVPVESLVSTAIVLTLQTPYQSSLLNRDENFF